MRSVNDILGFCIKAWSGNKRIHIKTGDDFKSDPEEAVVEIPNYYGSLYPNLLGLPRWRLWRFYAFHIAMLQLISPRGRARVIEGIATKLEMKESGYHGLILGVHTAVEDYRVEKIGLRTYRGYVAEQRYVRGFVAESEKRLKYPSIEPVMKAYQSFLKSLMFDIQPKYDLPFFEEIVAEARAVETLDELVSATTNITQKLVLRYGPPPGYSEFEVESMVVPSDVLDHDVKEAEAKLSKDIVNPTKSIIQEYSTIKREHARLLDEEARKRTEQSNLEAKAEFQRVENGLTIKQIEYMKDAYRITQGTQMHTNRLIANLRKWQSGWDETLDYSGAEVDIDSYLLERKDTVKGRFFVDERQISPRSNIAILLDMSSSISTLEEQYLKSIVIIGEALSYFRMNFSIFVFNQGYFYIVKMCREPWSMGIKEKLASLENKGGTPLAEALRLTQYYSNAENCRNIVVITDGEPNDMRGAAEVIRMVEASGTSVSIIGFRHANKRTYTRFFNLLGNRQGRVRVINNVDTLPDAFFDSIRVTSE
ncbi:MAG: vWA domain-containing protein [Candidatus Bathyarchaeia archaeon]|jgi:hypothetical protein